MPRVVQRLLEASKRAKHSTGCRVGGGFGCEGLRVRVLGSLAEEL